MPQKKPLNPFYAVLVPVGVAFVLTACMYGVMTYRRLDPRAPETSGGLVEFIDAYGLTIMVVELILLGILTFAAIATDDYWTRRSETK